MRSLVLSLALIGCGGQVSEAPSAQDAGVDAAPVLPHPPSKHRATAIVCPTPALPPEPNLDRSFGPSAKFECKLHEQCVAAANGRCIAFDTSPPTEPGGTRCIYSLCNSDADCGSAVCECGDVANACVSGNCHVDADCPSGFCSPSFDICSHAVTGYWCHTAADECIDDGDCDATHFLDNCVADPATARWTCPPARCGA